MLHYTARNGTTFHFDAQLTNNVEVISADQEGAADHNCGIQLDVDDLREFIQHLEEQCDFLFDLPPDADAAAVGPD